MALEAFEAGAVELVQKPTALATDRVYEIADELIRKVRAAGAATMHQVPTEIREARAATVPATGRHPGHCDVVVLGISTGGPQALRRLIPRLPADLPVGLAVVLHMPVGYTEMYAQRLDAISALEVREAREGDELRGGRVLLAPAGRHLTFRRSDRAVVAHLDDRPSDTQHRPAVDVLFRSAADTFCARVLGVVMTGMGTDGLLGSAHIKAQGGRVLTEAESTCVVYGMPRAVAEASLSDRVAGLDEMAEAIVEMI
jgi:two-component system chemotaxis response regulator CheB